ncbi:hypothetical protein FSP39_009044 [Pinctada imbricata]|uniref:Calpain-5-like n=1 Tax=Pinctada imbricata TaxID=66713 RepID=A0AA88XE17_PINIB|nr:hypothetical protein FSP39_009044 [Pinctada imbricata]
MISGLFDSATPYNGQKYSHLKKECVSQGRLFEDPEFPPNSKSLFYSQRAPSYIQWKRPGDIVADPKFFDEGASADDFSQGSLGNCWFVAACSCIAEDKKLLKKIVPDMEEQEWSKDNKYAGIFHFRFWQLGEWVDVVIDDYLPVDNSGNLVYVQSKAKNEFWSALLEKAYAKLFGDYESLKGGQAKDAMVDMTGGVGEGFELADVCKSDEDKNKLFKILKKSKEHHSLISASIRATSQHDMEAKMSCGLVKGHAYSVTAVKNIRLGKGLMSYFNREKIHMMRCRNPWGGTEWKGAWSDGSVEWQQVSSSEKKDMGLTFDEDGDFWMTYEDFLCYFTSMDICHMLNTSFISLSKSYREGKALGEWKRGKCGGCSNYPSFLQNPQYKFDVDDAEVEVMISLEQWDGRINRDKGRDNETIGFCVMKTDRNRKYRMHDTLEKVQTTSYSNSRNQFVRLTLTEGRYCIIPTTFEPNVQCKFLLRVYGNSDPSLKELYLDEPPPPDSGIFGIGGKKPKVAATQITVIRAEGLEVQDRDGFSDPYVVIFCEKKKERTRIIKNNINPEWNERMTFYHRKPHEDIDVEIWNYNKIRDELLGAFVIPMSDRTRYSSAHHIQKFDLFGKGKESSMKKPGCLWLKILHTKDMDKI